ncbi:histidine phosphatase family protein [Paratractidigestivibacter faecalis]|uniref:histidine phosphatase family protein n=1 Tax=Paratractidigestivibacter faecalis TaxID=2292441 RepID=UPI003A94F1AB
MKRLYLVRHGQTEFNLAKLVQGRCDSPLTELGRTQALAAGSWLANHEVRPDAVGTSPLGRAFATTGLLMSVLTERGLMDQAVVPRVELGLMERDYGSYERGPQADVPANVWDPGDALVACGGEGNSALRARVLAALRALLAPAEVTCALAVSHGSASKQFLAAVLPDEKDVPKALPNCAIMACDHDEASGEFFVRDIIDPCA